MLKKLIAKNDPSTISTLTTASLLGLHLVSGIVAGGLIGYGLDVWLGTDPKCLMAGFFIGILAGFKNLYVDAKKIINAQQNKPEHKSD